MSVRSILSLIVFVYGAAAATRDPRSLAAEQDVRQGHYAEATAGFLTVYQDALKTGVEDEALADAASDLAGAYLATDRYSEVEPLLRRAIEITARIHGKDSPGVAVHEIGLAKLFTAQRRLALADSTLAHALPILQTAFGPDSSRVATALNQLGLLEDLLDRLPQAAEHYWQAIRIYGKQTDVHRALTAVVSINLLAVLIDQQKYSEADAIGQQTVELALKVWGPNHPFTARAVHAMGTVYQAQRRLDEAQQMYLRALNAWEKNPGAGKLDSATAQASLAGIYADRGYFAKAESLLKVAIASRESVMGVNDPELAHILNNLGVCYASQGRFTEAERVLERGLALFDLAKDTRRSRGIPVVKNLAGVYWSEARLNKNYYPKAEAMYRRTLAMEEARFGPDGIELADTLVQLATVCAAEKKFHEARQVEERALAIRRAVLGPQHPDTLSALKVYTSLLRKSKD